MRYLLVYKLTGIQEQVVQELRKEISSKFDVYQALRIPPHMTLFYPFDFDEKRLPEMEKVLADFASEQSGLPLVVKEFSSFDNKVWFIDVEQDQKLILLKENLVKHIYDNLGIKENRNGHNGVHFHITLAYRDVSPEKFAGIGELLKTRQVPISNLVIDRLTLFKNIDKIWVEENSWPLLRF